MLRSFLASLRFPRRVPGSGPGRVPRLVMGGILRHAPCHPARSVPARLALAAALAAGAFLAPGGEGARAADFYKGKTVKVLIGFSPGGGFDAYGRLVARFMGRHIPGHPRMIANNMPGASGLKAVQALRALPKDGTVMAIFNAGLVLKSLTSPDKVKMDFRTVAFLGSVTSDVRVCYMWHTTGVKSWDDLTKKKQIVLGATSTSSGSYLDGALLRNVFGLPVKQITGYPGSAEQRLAIERGELDGDCGSWESIPEHWKTGSRIYVTHRNSRGTAPGINAPFILDLAKTEEQKKVLGLVLAINDIFRPFVVSRDVPKDRLKILRDALWATVHDKDFLATAAKEHRTIDSPVRGEEADEIVAKMYETPPALVKKAAQAIK